MQQKSIVGAGSTVPVSSFNARQLKDMSTRCVLAPDAAIANLVIDYDENQGTTIVYTRRNEQNTNATQPPSVDWADLL